MEVVDTMSQNITLIYCTICKILLIRYTILYFETAGNYWRIEEGGVLITVTVLINIMIYMHVCYAHMNRGMKVYTNLTIVKVMGIQHESKLRFPKLMIFSEL